MHAGFVSAERTGSPVLGQGILGVNVKAVAREGGSLKVRMAVRNVKSFEGKLLHMLQTERIRSVPGFCLQA